MSIFKGSYEENNACGEFKIVEFGTHFEYRVSKGNAEGQGDWGLKNGFMHEIAVCDGSVRFANVKKTVAYVAVDEDDEGNPVIEKWLIKHTWMKPERS